MMDVRTEIVHVAGSTCGWHMTSSASAEVALHDTTPRMLARNARQAPDLIAQREKEFGIWTTYTWRSVEDHVRRMSIGLAGLGVAPGDVVVLIGDNRPAWVWGEIAAHACRARSLGIYRDALEDEIAYLCDYTSPKVVIAEDEEQVDKFLNLGGRVPSVKRIVYLDPRGMRKYDDPRLMVIAELEASGQAVLDRDPGCYERMLAATRADDVAILCTTSGTTSHPKLAEWTHRAFLGHAASYLEADPKDADDEYVAVLPLSWVMEQMYSVGWNLIARMKVNFPEEQATVMADLREIGPTFLLLAPRVWEQIAADVRARMMDSSAWKQAIYQWGVGRGVAAVEAGGHSWLADKLVFSALRDRLGFKYLTSAATGGAAMGPDTFKFFLAMRVPLRQLYGQTEALGAHTIHRADDVHHETVGYPMPGVEIAIRQPDQEGLGEIIVRHPYMMTAYYKNPAASAEMFDAEGWFLTGDAGYLTPGRHLVVVDRAKDLAVTSTGVRFSPQYIENKLKFSPFVAEAVIIGAGRPYLTALVCIRYPVVGKWAEKRRITFTTYTDLAARPEVYALLRKEVEGVNASLPEGQRIRKFVLLYKELDADDGELTRTRKVRRGVIAEKYGAIIDALYSDAAYVDIDTWIHFQDGTKQRIVTKLKNESLEAEPGGARARMNWDLLIQLLVNGLIVGMLYGVVAMCFTLIYKSTQVVNFAQGEFLVLGAWICWYFIVKWQLPFVAAFAFALVFTTLFGILVQVVMLRPLVGEPIISVIMVTIGLSIFMQAVMNWAFGNNAVRFPNVFSTEKITIAGLNVETAYLMSFVLSLVIMIVFFYFFRYSRYGLAMRATAYSQQVAQSLGISVKQVFAMAWAISALVSCVAGVVLGLVNAVSNSLAIIGIKVFPAVIVGGLDSIVGAVVGGVIIGLLENFAEFIDGQYLHVGNMYTVAPFYVLIIILMIRPYGLFGTENIERM